MSATKRCTQQELAPVPSRPGAFRAGGVASRLHRRPPESRTLSFLPDSSTPPRAGGPVPAAASRGRQEPAAASRGQQPPAQRSAAGPGAGGAGRVRGLVPGSGARPGAALRSSAVRARRAGPVPVPCAPALGGGSRGRCCRGSAIRSHRACPREEPVALWCLHRVAG